MPAGPEKYSPAARGPSRLPRFQAWIQHRLDAWSAGTYHGVKLPVFGPVGGKVLEIGAGTGLNFGYYPRGTQVTAVEPNRLLAGTLRRRGDDAGLELAILDCGAERLPLDDASIDHVVGTLVLCSVADPPAVLAEIRRVLKPGGSYHFVEHVHGRSWTAGVQTVLYHPWKLLFGGCRLNQDTAALIGRAGFGGQWISPCGIGPRWLPIRPHIVGRVIRC